MSVRHMRSCIRPPPSSWGQSLLLSLTNLAIASNFNKSVQTVARGQISYNAVKWDIARFILKIQVFIKISEMWVGFRNFTWFRNLFIFKVSCCYVLMVNYAVKQEEDLWSDHISYVRLDLPYSQPSHALRLLQYWQVYLTKLQHPVE